MASISTVIPSFNSDRGHLTEALRSLEDQTVQPHEVIVVDDGSERPVEIGPHQLPLRRVLRPHCGIAQTRNAGIAAATGEVIHILDHDDRVEPEFYEALGSEIDSGADVAFCAMRYIGASGQRLNDDWFPPRSFLGCDDWFGELLARNRIGSSAAVFRRSVWNRAAGFTDWPTTQDWRFWLDAARAGCEFRYVQRPLADHRRHPAQATHEAHRLQVLLECAAMIADTPVKGRRRWARSHAVARWRLEAASVASGWQKVALLSSAAWRRPRTTVAVVRGRWN